MSTSKKTSANTTKRTTTTPKKKRQPQTRYSEAVAAELCARLSMGASLRTVCNSDDMPQISTVYEWFRLHPGFLDMYRAAKQEAADALAEEILDISDAATPENVQTARLRVDTRKFLMAKMKPKRYGDKIDVTSDGKALPTPIFGGLAKDIDDLAPKKE